MDRERGDIHRAIALDDFALRVHQDQVGHPDVPEMHAERIHPEMVRPLRVARRDVPRHTLVKTEFRKQPERSGEPLLAVAAFLFNRGEFRNRGNFEDASGCGTHRSPRAEN